MTTKIYPSAYKISHFNIDLFDEPLVGTEGKTGATLTFANNRQQPVCDIVLFAQQGFASYQVINHHAGTSKTLLYSEQNNPKGAHGGKNAQGYLAVPAELMQQGLTTRTLQLLYQQDNLKQEKQGLSFLYEFQHVPWQHKSQLPKKMGESDVTAYLLEQARPYTWSPQKPLAANKKAINKNRDLVREKWQGQILPFSAYYLNNHPQDNLPYNLANYLHGSDGIFEIGLAFDQAIDTQRQPAKKANGLKQANGITLTPQDMQAAHASPMLLLMRDAVHSILVQKNSSQQMAYFLKNMVVLGKTHFIKQQPTPA